MAAPPGDVYLVTVLPGLEAVVISELAAKLPTARLREAARGRVVFASEAAAADLLQLRTIDCVNRRQGFRELSKERVQVLRIVLGWPTRKTVGQDRWHVADLSVWIDRDHPWRWYRGVSEEL